VEVEGKVAVVTGGARRVGRAIVEALAASGARPVIHYHRSRAEAEALADATGGRCARADLSRPDGARQLARRALELSAEMGELAVWVNSAATFERVPYLEGDDELWARTLQLVLLSPVTCVRAAAPRMADGGVIVNVLDVAATQPWKGYAHHSAAKAALQMLTRSLAVELAPRLRVCAVTPGLVLPPRGTPERQVERWTARVPLGRQGDPRDVGRAVRFLVESDYLTGGVIAVDGGLSAL
jgi:NAD(P)-dependent dehydrogenase (short-subunit alcohol dehydrogenase family)